MVNAMLKVREIIIPPDGPNVTFEQARAVFLELKREREAREREKKQQAQPRRKSARKG